ncbi:MAG: hypothetical protein JW861_12550 [Bacteroidales bacterium]|nr:hypothetical protein [Bacteroidales bacterium]
MRYFPIIGCIITFLIMATGFFPIMSEAQDMLLVQRSDLAKRFIYREGEMIRLMVIDGTRVSGEIKGIGDSTMHISDYGEVPYSRISMVCRRSRGFSLLSEVFLKAGIPYFLISTLNRGINNDQPVVPEETIWISSGLTVTGLLFCPLSVRKFRVEGGRWKLVTLLPDDEIR